MRLFSAFALSVALVVTGCYDDSELREQMNNQQAEMNAALQELRAADAELNGLVSAIAARVAELEATVDGIETSVGNLGTEVDNLETEVDNLETEVGGIKTDMEDIDTGLSELENSINALQNRVSQLENHVPDSGNTGNGGSGETGDDYAEQIAAMQKELADLKSAVQSSRDMYSKLESNMMGLQEMLYQHDSNIDEVRGRLESYEAFMAEFNEFKAWVQQELDIIKADIENIKSSLLELITADANLNALISALNSRVEQLEAEITALKNGESGGNSGTVTPPDDSQVENLEVRIAALEQELQAINTALESLGTKDDELEDAIHNLAAIVATNKTEAEATFADLAEFNALKEAVETLEEEYAKEFGLIKYDINTIKQSLTSLEDADETLEGLIAALQERAAEIEKSIKTLEQSVTDEIDALNAKIDELNTDLEAVNTAIAELKAKDSETDAAIASLRAALEAHEAAVKQTLAEYLADVQGISDDFTALLNQHIQSSQTAFTQQTETINALAEDIAAMKEQYEAEFNLIKKDIADIVAMIQSMTPISKYDDGVAEGIFFSGPTDAENVALIEYNYIVRPAGAAEKLAQAWAENNDLMQFRGHYTVTRASFDFVDMEIKDVTASEDILTVTAYVDGISKESCNNVAYTERFSASLLVTDGKTDYSTDFVNLYCINTGYTLSNPECANCYMVSTGIVGETEYARFKIQRGVNGGSFEESPYELHGVPTGTPHSADVLWESNGTVELTEVGSVVDPEIDIHNGYIYFQTPDSDKSGNAVIALRDENGDILWTWHIWRFNNTGTSYYDNYGYGYMNCNLGHVGETEGLMYQWGRKDPFLGTAWDSDRQKPVAITSTLTWPEPVPSDTRFVSQVSYTVSNPTTFITANSINDHWFYLSSLPSEGYGVWYSDLNKKSDFDPCPPGYKVPSVDYQLLSSMNIQDLQWGVDTDAGTLSKDDRPDGWPVVADRAYAFTGYLSEDTGSIVRDRSFYWSCNVYGDTFSYRCMEVDKDGYMKRVSTSAPGARGAYIRCMKME